MNEFELEMDNLSRMYKRHQPQSGDIPILPGIETASKSMPLHGDMGGDHIIHVDFNKRKFRLEQILSQATGERKELLERHYHRQGHLIVDVAGHQRTDCAVNIGSLHQPFLVGVRYELMLFGEVTPHLFHVLNDRFVETSDFTKSVTLLYGEVNDAGEFRFFLSGHPTPKVYSAERKQLVNIGEHRFMRMPPIGWFDWGDPFKHSQRCQEKGFEYVNSLRLMGSGDVLVLYTDGLLEHEREGVSYIPVRLADVLNQTQGWDIGERADAIEEDVRSYARQEDDISYILIEKK